MLAYELDQGDHHPEAGSREHEKNPAFYIVRKAVEGFP
jgi:hypothetical protein